LAPLLAVGSAPSLLPSLSSPLSLPQELAALLPPLPGSLAPSPSLPRSLLSLPPPFWLAFLACAPPPPRCLAECAPLFVESERSDPGPAHATVPLPPPLTTLDELCNPACSVPPAPVAPVPTRALPPVEAAAPAQLLELSSAWQSKAAAEVAVDAVSSVLRTWPAIGGCELGAVGT